MRLHDCLYPQVAAVAFGMRRGGGAGVVGVSRAADSISITADDGTSVQIPAASQVSAGVMGSSDKAKLDALSGARISLRSDLAAADVPAEVASVRTDGYAAPGDLGSGLYVRRPDEPPHEGKVQSADGAWWELAPEAQVRATQFGATEGADITAAVQNAINFAAYGATSGGTRTSKPADVLIDIRRGTLSDTIQVGYGLDFQTVIVRGLGQGYVNSAQDMGTVLTCTMTDRPAFAMSATRDSRLSDLTIIGAADSDIQAIGPTGKGPTLEATWDAALTAAGVTPGRRYAPYAGIAIDPYAGTAPATAYPDVTCPSWIEPAFTRYGKKRSTAPAIERVTIRGFEVGIAQTPADIDSNGDFPTMRHVRFDGNKWAFSTGNNQGRVPTFYSCQFADIWTVYTDNTHGKQNGTSNGLFLSCGFGGFIGRLFSLATLARGGMTFQTCDIESLHRIGDIASSATGQIGVWFRDSSLNFRHSDTNGHPANILDGNGSRGMVGFDGGDILFASVGSVLDARVKVINGTMVNFTDGAGSRDKAYGQVASNALAGGFVLSPNDLVPEFECVFASYDLDAGINHGALLLGPECRETGRAFTVPLWSGAVQRGGGAIKRRREALRRPVLFDRRDRSSGAYGSAPVRSGLTISFNAGSLATNQQNAVQQGYRNGGVIRDTVTGTVMFIRSVDHATGAIEAELQNNYIADGAGGYDLFDDGFVLSAGVWDVIGTAVYLAPQPIMGTTSTTAATIAVEATLDAPDGAYGLAVGDWLFEDLWPAAQTFSSTGRAKIAAIAAGGAMAAGTITMGGNANVTHARALSFDWWVRAEPANEAAR